MVKAEAEAEAGARHKASPLLLSQREVRRLIELQRDGQGDQETSYLLQGWLLYLPPP